MIKIKQNNSALKINALVIDKNNVKTSEATVLFFIAGWYDNTGEKVRVKEQKKSMFRGKKLESQAFGILLLNSRQRYEFAINSRYLFMWDKKKIEFYDLKLPLKRENKLFVNFKISNS